jgi:two-component system, cell cycle sensor histidine kinase and response regulator CckA
LPSTSPTVLVLEDDESSRFVLREIIESAGFNVLETVGPADAIEVCRRHPGAIAAMISDVVLRETGGPETVRQLKALQPDMAVLFVSGYPLAHLENRGMLDSSDLLGNRMDFLQKPFTAQKLLGVVRELIGAPLTPK